MQNTSTPGATKLQIDFILAKMFLADRVKEFPKLKKFLRLRLH